MRCLVLLVCFLLAGLCYSNSCSAQAEDCNASCSETSPPGGSTVCTSGSDFARCLARDAFGNEIRIKERFCAVGGGVGGPECDFSNPYYWIFCDPFAM